MLLLRSFKLAALALFIAATSARAQDPGNEPATIIIRVPASARLFVEGVRSTQTGPTRKIVTEPLEPGYKYSYKLRVEIGQEDEPRSVTRTVHFRAGETTTVDLSDLARAPKKEEKQPAGGFKLARHEKELLELLNKERDKEGVAPLTANAKLFQAARDHTANMAKQDKLDHTLDGKDPSERIDAAGYASGTWGENIAAGQRTPAEVVSSWMNSEGHRANILNGQFTEIGIGRVPSENGTPYWTLVFARPRGK